MVLPWRYRARSTRNLYTPSVLSLNNHSLTPDNYRVRLSSYALLAIMVFSNDRVLRMYNLPTPENSRFSRFACSQIRTIILFFNAQMLASIHAQIQPTRSSPENKLHLPDLDPPRSSACYRSFSPANGTSIIRIQQEPSMQCKEARVSKLPYIKPYRPYGPCI